MASVLSKILRIAIGTLLVCIGSSFLIEGGLSRYAKFGMPPHADWRYIAIGLALLAVGGFAIRPFWWRYLGRR